MNREKILALANESANEAVHSTPAEFGISISDMRELQYIIFAKKIISYIKEEDAVLCESGPERQRGDGIYAADQQACADAIRKSK